MTNLAMSRENETDDGRTNERKGTESEKLVDEKQADQENQGTSTMKRLMNKEYGAKKAKGSGTDKTRFGTWNVRTLLKMGRMEEVAREMLRYRLGVLALQEIRWGGEGRIDKERYTFFYGGESKQGENGTGFMIDRRYRERIIEFKKINSRISMLRMKNKIANITIVNIYAPTEESDEEKKNEFYEELEKTCDRINKHDTLILLGDFNGKIGKEEYISNVAGRYTIHEETNDNGHRVCNLAEEMGMYIVSTKFEHKIEHNVTYYSWEKTLEIRSIMF